jgi:TIR domain-containing protein
MGYVPGYENDVFISYAHADNEPILPDKPGWVDFFEDLLRKRVKARLRGEIQFFRDQQLRLYRKFSDQLTEELANSAVLICIPSPNYVESDWCLWELEQFYKRTGSDRIIKVVKTHFDEQSLKPNARSLLKRIEHVLDSRFYARNESTGFIEDLLPEVNPEHVMVCLQKIEVIAQNLVELFKKLCAPGPSSPSATSATAPRAEQVAEPSVRPQIAVYLAEPAKGLEAEYNSVKSELLQFNYRVLPDQPAPLDAEDLIHTVRRHLQEARLFVHLIGAKYGVRPDGDDRSVPHIQYDLAAELDAQRQIVWLPPDLAPENKNQEEFITRIKNHSPNYWQTKLEDMKTAIRKKLQPASPSSWKNNGEDDADLVNLCLFYHEEDQDSVRPLFNHLTFNEPFNVKVPLKDAESLRDHKQLLQTSDAVLMYYGAAGQDWFVNIWNLIKKFSSAGRSKPILARAIYAGQPSTPEKDMLEFDDPLIIKNYGPFTPNALAPFIDRIRATKGGAR